LAAAAARPGWSVGAKDWGSGAVADAGVAMWFMSGLALSTLPG
jgi:hypothetical protein